MDGSHSASAGFLPAKGLSEAQVRTFILSILPEINKGHNKPAFYGNLHRLDSYVLEHTSRVRIVTVPTRPENPIESATGLLKAQAEDIWSIGLLSLALVCGIRTPIRGIFGSRLREGNLSGLVSGDVDLEEELFDLIASLRQKEEVSLFGPSLQPNLPHISRHFADFLVQVLQADWRRRPYAKDLLDGEFAFLHAHRSSASLPSTLFPVQRPFQRRVSAPIACSVEAGDESSTWSRLREAETSFGHLRTTRVRSSLPVLSPLQRKSASPKIPTRSHKEGPPERKARTPLQDISNIAQGDITVEHQQRERYPLPEWRDDTTLLEDVASPMTRPSKRGQHLLALAKLSQHVNPGHKQDLSHAVEELSLPPKPSPRTEAERRPLTVSPEYRYSRSRRASLAETPVRSRSRTLHPAEPEISTWSDSEVEEEHEEQERRLSISHKSRSFAAGGMRHSSSRDVETAETSGPMQSTPPRPTRKVVQQSPTAKGVQASPGPTLAQKRLVRRALGSPEMNAAWSSKRSSKLSNRSTTQEDSLSLASAQRERSTRVLSDDDGDVYDAVAKVSNFVTPAQRKSSTRVRSDGDGEVYDVGVKASNFVTPARVPKSGSGVVSSATRSSMFPASPFSSAGSTEPPPLLDLRGLEGIRQRTRYGKIYVLPNADEATQSRAEDRPQKIRLVKKTVLIALRGEGRGVGIQADVESISSKTTSAWALPSITVSVGVLQPSDQASDVPGRLENWQSWKINLQRKDDEEDGEDVPPDWVLRVYAHICRWAQRRRQDLLRRVHA
ncbi:hypothetical protein A4X13_0g3481 [Tilletia indica]|uniref:Uncharacterized protein n=1 Tax=Tilletia indica TaxID=43049 RepID=A0A177TGP7_9BASI|nr:hypothetical protein A4X13_0g3481 [Tilletia indica]